ncbi:MAG: non-hydrolyzing UDP-N-acetylglucosamine 2-epimerase [Longimicrobiales bacterium]
MILAAKRVLLVIGTRPEVIKMAPVVQAFRAYEPDLNARVAFTGQHTTLVDSVMGAFEVVPDFDLAIMKPDQTVYDVLSAASQGLAGVIREFRPDMLLAQGDTATVFAASLAGFLERVPVGHVEAGLRSGDKTAPWPEEVFRRMTDVIADHYFAPTPRARDLLLAEGVPRASIHVTGNTVVDALLDVASREHAVTNEALQAILAAPDNPRLVLLTAHRRESFGAPLHRIFTAVRRIVEAHPDVHVLYPVHPNPNVRGPAHEALEGIERVHLTEPLNYVDTVISLRRAALVLTDSGGLQEEAPAFGTPVLVLRSVTERPEGVEAGVAHLVGSDVELIVSESTHALSRSRGNSVNPYGDGNAAARIADVVASELLDRPRETLDWAGSPSSTA